MHVNHPEEVFGLANMRLGVEQHPESYERTRRIGQGKHAMVHTHGLNPQLTSFKGIDTPGTKEDPIVVEDTPMTLEGKREPFLSNECLD